MWGSSNILAGTHLPYSSPQTLSRKKPSCLYEARVTWEKRCAVHYIYCGFVAWKCSVELHCMISQDFTIVRPQLSPAAWRGREKGLALVHAS